jgi:Family of unknown function (DUF6266)
MLKITDRLFNILIGKLVPVTGYSRHIENVFMPLSHRAENKQVSPKLMQAEKIRITKNFVAAFGIRNFFETTFPAASGPLNGSRLASQMIMDQAIVGSYPHSRLSYPQLLISKGTLPGAPDAAAADDEQHNILFNWNSNTANDAAKGSDTVVIVAYFPEVKKVIYSMTAKREEGKALLDTSEMEGCNAETWIGFVSQDTKDAANSRYTGTIYL